MRGIVVVVVLGLVGSKDVVRARMEVEGTRAIVQVLEAQANHWSSVYSTKESSGVGCFDKNGQPRVGMAMMSNVGPSLVVQDEKGKKRAALHVFPNGPGLALEQDGIPRLNLGCSQFLGAPQEGEKKQTISSIVIRDKTGMPTWQVP